MKYLILATTLFCSHAFADEIAPEAIADLPAVDVTYLGELHDNPWHHENQILVLEELAAKAVVFEMISSAQAEALTREQLASKETLREALDWDHSGWPDFDMYFPIFAAVGDAEIYGAQVPRDAVRAAIMGNDVASSFGEGAAEFGLATPLDPDEQAEREAKQMEAHCNALPESMLAGMVLGQRLRDATMAREIQRAFDETGGPVVVITGNGHARTDWGAPRLVSENLSQRSIAQLEYKPDDVIPHDFYIVTPEAEREDPCLAFKKG